MEFFKIRRDIPFMRHALVFNAVSFITFVAAVFFLVFNEGCDSSHPHNEENMGTRKKSQTKIYMDEQDIQDKNDR